MWGTTFSPSPYISISAALVGPNKTTVRRPKASEQVHSQRISTDHHAARPNNCCEMAHRVVAAAIDQRDLGSRRQPPVPLALPAHHKHELTLPLPASRFIKSR
jgi:hypothetical protein